VLVVLSHFFLECPINEQIRNTLFLILQIYGAIDIDIDIIVHGNENLSWAQHVDIFTAVQTFIVIVICLIVVAGVTFTSSLFFFFFFVKSISSFCKRLISLIHCSNIYFY
jgi:hypothetical protein